MRMYYIYVGDKLKESQSVDLETYSSKLSIHVHISFSVTCSHAHTKGVIIYNYYSKASHNAYECMIL